MAPTLKVSASSGFRSGVAVVVVRLVAAIDAARRNQRRGEAVQQLRLLRATESAAGRAAQCQPVERLPTQRNLRIAWSSPPGRRSLRSAAATCACNDSSSGRFTSPNTPNTSRLRSWLRSGPKNVNTPNWVVQPRLPLTGVSTHGFLLDVGQEIDVALVTFVAILTAGRPNRWRRPATTAAARR